MIVLLDTNVVSEVIKPRPAPMVARWVRDRPPDDTFICAVTEAELLYGLALMPSGRRRSLLEAAVARMLSLVFVGRIWPFDSAAAAEYATLAAARQLAGRPVSIPDGQLAAIARARGAAIATRNIRDFQGCGIEIINPWDGPPEHGAVLTGHIASEDGSVERPALELLQDLGWTLGNLQNETPGPANPTGRTSCKQTYLPARLRATLAKLNPACRQKP